MLIQTSCFLMVKAAKPPLFERDNMYSIISAGIGALISIMILFNGAMSNTVGNGMALLLIHFTGLITLILVFLSQRVSKRNNLIGDAQNLGELKNIPLYLFSAGAIGIFIVTFNNVSFLNIGMSLTLALGLLGQALIALVFDHYGFLGMKKVKFRRKKLIGLGMITIGIIVMTVL